MSDTGKSAAEMMAGISVKPTAAELRDAKKREAETERALLAVGTIWRENDPSFERPRFIKVVATTTTHPYYVEIRRVDANGDFISTRTTKARRDRFGGTKRGNYAFVRAQ